MFSFLHAHVGDDDLFSTGSMSKKSIAAAPVSKPIPHLSVNDIFSPDSDDLFTEDNLCSGGASKTPVQATATEARSCKQESPTVIVAIKQPQRSIDLFASSPELDNHEEDSDDLFLSTPKKNTSLQVSKAKQPPTSAMTTLPLLKKEASPKVAIKKEMLTMGSLYGGSDESDIDLFSAPKSKKFTEPDQASKLSTRVAVSDDLFLNDPLGASYKLQSKAKPVTTKKALPSDDLFADPSLPPQLQGTKPTMKTAAANDDDDDLFSDPIFCKSRVSDDDLFAVPKKQPVSCRRNEVIRKRKTQNLLTFISKLW